MQELIEQIKNARFIWICGNGGSASTAEHFATDLVKKGYRAIALSSNTSTITMLANDFGYELIFSEQLNLYATHEDLLITISCSGTSQNITNALLVALAKDMLIYSFDYFKGKDRDFGRLENKHLKFAHAVSKAL